MPDDQNLRQLELLAQQRYLQGIKSPWRSVGDLFQQLTPYMASIGSALAQQKQSERALDAQVSMEAARQRGFEEKRAHEKTMEEMNLQFKKDMAAQDEKYRQRQLDIEQQRADAYGRSMELGRGNYSEGLGGESTKAMRSSALKDIDAMSKWAKGADGIEQSPFLRRDEALALKAQLHRASTVDEIEDVMRAALRAKEGAQQGLRGDYEYDKTQGLLEAFSILGLGGGGAGGGGLLQQPQGMLPQSGTLDPQMFGALLKQIGGGDTSVMTGTPTSAPSIMDQLFEEMRGRFGLMPGDENYEAVMARAKHYLDRGVPLEEAVAKAAGEYKLTQQGVAGNAGRPAVLRPPGAQ